MQKKEVRFPVDFYGFSYSLVVIYHLVVINRRGSKNAVGDQKVPFHRWVILGDSETVDFMTFRHL